MVSTRMKCAVTRRKLTNHFKVLVFVVTITRSQFAVLTTAGLVIDTMFWMSANTRSWRVG